MADIEKVIEVLEICTTPHCTCEGCPRRPTDDETDCSNDLMKDALELLKPLCEAMKPTGLRMWHDGYVGDCPSCGRVVQFAQKYCHNCTRLLDWGEVLALPCEDDEET